MLPQLLMLRKTLHMLNYAMFTATFALYFLQVIQGPQAYKEK